MHAVNKILTIFFLISNLMINAQESIKPSRALWSEQPESLQGLMSFALKNNPQLKAIASRWQAIHSKVDVVKGFEDPMISVAYMIEPIQTKSGPQEIQLRIAQKLPWFGLRKSKGDAVSAMANKVYLEYNEQASLLIKSIKQYYYHLAYLKKKDQIIQDNLTLLKTIEPVINKRFQAGGSKSDILKLQINIDETEQMLTTNQAETETISSQLKAVLGEMKINIPEPVLRVSIPDKNQIAEDLNKWAEILYVENPMLLTQTKAIDASNKNILVAQKMRRPMFEFGFNYLLTDDENSMYKAGKDPFGVTMGVSIPLWNKKYNGLERIAKADLEKEQNILEKQKLLIKESWDKETNRLLDIHSKIILYRDKITPKTQQIIDIDITSYSAGNISIQDLMASIREHLKYENLRWLQFLEWEKEVAAIEALLGGLTYEIKH